MLAEAESDAKLRAKARKLRVSEEENSNLDENVGEWCQSSQSRGHTPHRALKWSGETTEATLPDGCLVFSEEWRGLGLVLIEEKNSFQGISKTQAAL